jgi:hypothetical protein
MLSEARPSRLRPGAAQVLANSRFIPGIERIPRFSLGKLPTATELKFGFILIFSIGAPLYSRAAIC